MTDKGSSRTWQAQGHFGFVQFGILNRRPAVNPHFHTWNKVFIGYCDGTSFSGNLVHTRKGLHYRGRANLDAALDKLIEECGMAKASDVVFTGNSAGGLATYLQLDHVASRLPSSTKVRGL
eukprot:gene57860-biopygen67048